MKSNEVRTNWRDVLDFVRAGGEIVVEHYNRTIARITPYEEPAMTAQDIRDHVIRATEASDGTYDVDAIVTEIGETYGYDADPEQIPGEEYWGIVGKHATDEDTEQIVLINATHGDKVPGVEVAELDDKLTFLTREDVKAFFADCGYGPDQPDELVYAFPAGEYTVPYGFPVQTFTVPASEAQAVRDAIRNA